MSRTGWRPLMGAQVIRDVTTELITKCKAMIDAEAKEAGTEEFGVDYLNESDPSILRFLLASREEVSSYVPPPHPRPLRA
jgi:hypothetical protein